MVRTMLEQETEKKKTKKLPIPVREQTGLHSPIHTMSNTSHHMQITSESTHQSEKTANLQLKIAQNKDSIGLTGMELFLSEKFIKHIIAPLKRKS